jgi:hypothetical protein
MEAKEKDPAFLFYCQAFYEGTRLMFPEERACYLDLLIYQHQHGPIPLDTTRMSLYCTGISNEMVNHILNQKFVKTDNGWINTKMVKVVNEREKNNPKKIASACLAGLISSNNLDEKLIKKIKEEFQINDYLNLETNQIKKEVKTWFYKMVNVFVNNIIKDKDKSKDKDLITRKDNFYNSIIPFLENYSKDMIDDFYNYWTEIGVNDIKMRFEKEKTFGISQRLSRWKKNESKFSTNKSQSIKTLVSNR